MIARRIYDGANAYDAREEISSAKKERRQFLAILDNNFFYNLLISNQIYITTRLALLQSIEIK